MLFRSLVRSENQFAIGRLKIYGDHASEIAEMINSEPELGLLADPRLPYTKAEMVWICRNEMPVVLEDLLARRTRALFLNAKASSDIAPLAAAIMAREAGHDRNWQKEQVESFNQLVKNYI